MCFYVYISMCLYTPPVVPSSIHPSNSTLCYPLIYHSFLLSLILTFLSGAPHCLWRRDPRSTEVVWPHRHLACNMDLLVVSKPLHVCGHLVKKNKKYKKSDRYFWSTFLVHSSEIGTVGVYTVYRFQYAVIILCYSGNFYERILQRK